ncbi:hypothetical protein D3C81_1815690 [compost metagenome]
MIGDCLLAIGGAGHAEINGIYSKPPGGLADIGQLRGRGRKAEGNRRAVSQITERGYLMLQRGPEMFLRQVDQMDLIALDYNPPDGTERLPRNLLPPGRYELEHRLQCAGADTQRCFPDHVILHPIVAVEHLRLACTAIAGQGNRGPAC